MLFIYYFDPKRYEYEQLGTTWKTLGEHLGRLGVKLCENTWKESDKYFWPSDHVIGALAGLGAFGGLDTAWPSRPSDLRSC